jgi:hypothetical protein
LATTTVTAAEEVSTREVVTKVAPAKDLKMSPTARADDEGRECSGLGTKQRPTTKSVTTKALSRMLSARKSTRAALKVVFGGVCVLDMVGT